MSRRNCQLVVSAVEVVCPFCGEAVPNPENGAFLWEPDLIAKHQGPRECDSCEEPITIVPGRKAQIVS